ncbi:hypothetical protein J6590_008714 [Homalodisca vitripennis]|nr:hypothetical protein J6590_008714 [Homalodisca vitripennis]
MVARSIHMNLTTHLIASVLYFLTERNAPLAASIGREKITAGRYRPRCSPHPPSSAASAKATAQDRPDSCCGTQEVAVSGSERLPTVAVERQRENSCLTMTGRHTFHTATMGHHLHSLGQGRHNRGCIPCRYTNRQQLGYVKHVAKRDDKNKKEKVFF